MSLANQTVQGLIGINVIKLLKINIEIKINDKQLIYSNILHNRDWITINFIDPLIYQSINDITINNSNSISNISLELTQRNNFKTDLFLKTITIPEIPKKNLKFAVIADEFTFNNFNLEVDCDYISYNKEIEPNKYNLFICESCWNGIDFNSLLF